MGKSEINPFGMTVTESSGTSGSDSEPEYATEMMPPPCDGKSCTSEWRWTHGWRRRGRENGKKGWTIRAMARTNASDDVYDDDGRPTSRSRAPIAHGPTTSTIHGNGTISHPGLSRLPWWASPSNERRPAEEMSQSPREEGAEARGVPAGPWRRSSPRWPMYAEEIPATNVPQPRLLAKNAWKVYWNWRRWSTGRSWFRQWNEETKRNLERNATENANNAEKCGRDLCSTCSRRWTFTLPLNQREMRGITLTSASKRKIPPKLKLQTDKKKVHFGGQ